MTTDAHEVERILRRHIYEALTELSEAKHIVDEAVLTLAKAFSPSTVSVGGTATTTMTVTITDPNGSSVSGVAVGQEPWHGLAGVGLRSGSWYMTVRDSSRLKSACRKDAEVYGLEPERGCTRLLTGLMDVYRRPGAAFCTVH